MVGQWCTWILMKNWGFCIGMYGSMEAEKDPARGLSLRLSSVFSEKNWTHQKCMSTTKYIDGLWRGERKFIDPKAGDVDLWNNMSEEMHL